MSHAQFPLPVSLFGRDLQRICVSALEAAWRQVEPEREGTGLSENAARLALAHGIVIAATLGARDQGRLSEAGLAHFKREAGRALPRLEPFDGEQQQERYAPERFRLRAERLRAALNEVASERAREVLTAAIADYERMARSAECMEFTRRRIGAQPPAPRAAAAN